MASLNSTNGSFCLVSIDVEFLVQVSRLHDEDATLGFIYFVSFRYAKHSTLGISNNRYWRAIVPCSLLQAIGQIFGVKVYQVTSNAGELALLIGVTIVVSLVQRDLVIAGSYANFLHKSNEAFVKAASLEAESMKRDGQEGAEHEDHKHHHNHHHNHGGHDAHGPVPESAINRHGNKLNIKDGVGGYSMVEMALTQPSNGNHV
jgi:hypothetical protein